MFNTSAVGAFILGIVVIALLLPFIPGGIKAASGNIKKTAAIVGCVALLAFGVVLVVGGGMFGIGQGAVTQFGIQTGTLDNIKLPGQP